MVSASDVVSARRLATAQKASRRLVPKVGVAGARLQRLRPDLKRNPADLIEPLRRLSINLPKGVPSVRPAVLRRRMDRITLCPSDSR